LWDVWDEQKPLILFIGLNPSNGDAEKDDQTLIKIRKFVLNYQNGNYGGFYIGNLFAFVTSKPTELLKSKEPVGVENNWHLLQMAAKCKMVICMWGNDGILGRRDREVCELLGFKKLYCFSITKDGSPMHPMAPISKHSEMGYELQEFKLPI
jgi:hypothetical protein